MCAKNYHRVLDKSKKDEVVPFLYTEPEFPVHQGGVWKLTDTMTVKNGIYELEFR